MQVQDFRFIEILPEMCLPHTAIHLVSFSIQSVCAASKKHRPRERFCSTTVTSITYQVLPVTNPQLPPLLLLCSRHEGIGLSDLATLTHSALWAPSSLANTSVCILDSLSLSREPFGDLTAQLGMMRATALTSGQVVCWENWPYQEDRAYSTEREGI